MIEFSVYERARNLRLIADRLVEAGEVGDEHLFALYTMEAELAITELAADSESESLDPPSNMSDREQVARDMLNDYHLARTNLSIREAILKRLTEKSGPTHPATLTAQGFDIDASVQVDMIQAQILELMGVDS